MPQTRKVVISRDVKCDETKSVKVPLSRTTRSNNDESMSTPSEDFPNENDPENAATAPSISDDSEIPTSQYRTLENANAKGNENQSSDELDAVGKELRRPQEFPALFFLQ